eukprot:17058-Heterococcus_DN1.PRE.3
MRWCRAAAYAALACRCACQAFFLQQSVRSDFAGRQGSLVSARHATSSSSSSRGVQMIGVDGDWSATQEWEMH